MSLAQEQWDTLELARQELHVANGESGDFILLKRNDSTNGVEVFKEICKGWSYSEKEALLRNGALYELRISELELDATDLKDAVAGKHGDQIFTVVQPTPLKPSGSHRYWRLWLMPCSEEQV